MSLTILQGETFPPHVELSPPAAIVEIPPIVAWWIGIQAIGVALNASATPEDEEFCISLWEAWNAHYERIVAGDGGVHEVVDGGGIYLTYELAIT